MNVSQMSYEEVYGKYYPKLPKYIALVAAIPLIFVGIVEVYMATDSFLDGYEGIWSFIIGKEAYTSAILAAFIWIILAVAAYFIDYVILKTIISQRIMVVQRLTEISKKK